MAVALLLSVLVTGLFALATLKVPPRVQTTTLGQVQLTLSASNVDPTFSPDGKQIAFSSNRSGAYEIWVMDANGRHEAQLTSLVGLARYPQWSSDGKQIAFLLKSHSSQDLWIVQADGSGLRNLTKGAAVGSFEWSPTGVNVAYDSRIGGSWNVWVVDAIGGGSTRLTHEGNNRYPSWSGDGRELLYSSDRSGSYKIWTMDAKGSSSVQLTTGEGSDTMPQISPDGFNLAFLSNRSGVWSVWLLDRAAGDYHDTLDSESRAIGSVSFTIELTNGSEIRWRTDGSGFLLVSQSDLLFVRKGNVTFSFFGRPMNEAMIQAYLVTRTIQMAGGKMLDANWSPDGSRITFSASFGSGTPQLYSFPFLPPKPRAGYG